jgi:hypothetical protein
MSSDPEFSPPQFHRISAFLIFELWPRVIEKIPGTQSPLERLRWLMYGLAICDYTAFRSRRDESTKRDVLTAFGQSYDTSLHIAIETQKEKERWFSMKVDVIAEKSDSSGLELWSMILTKSNLNSNGDYWGSVDFQNHFEKSYALKFNEEGDTKRFRDALKNTKSRIRRAEKEHRKIFEDLIIDCAVEGETQNGAPEKAEEVRNRFNQDRPEHIANFLKEVFRAHSNAATSVEGLSKVSTSLKRNRLRASLPPMLPPPPSRRESE